MAPYPPPKKNQSKLTLFDGGCHWIFIFSSKNNHLYFLSRINSNSKTLYHSIYDLFRKKKKISSPKSLPPPPPPLTPKCKTTLFGRGRCHRMSIYSSNNNHFQFLYKIISKIISWIIYSFKNLHHQTDLE